MPRHYEDNEFGVSGYLGFGRSENGQSLSSKKNGKKKTNGLTLQQQLAAVEGRPTGTVGTSSIAPVISIPTREATLADIEGEGGQAYTGDRTTTRSTGQEETLAEIEGRVDVDTEFFNRFRYGQEDYDYAGLSPDAQEDIRQSYESGGGRSGTWSTEDYDVEVPVSYAAAGPNWQQRFINYAARELWSGYDVMADPGGNFVLVDQSSGRTHMVDQNQLAAIWDGYFKNRDVTYDDLTDEDLIDFFDWHIRADTGMQIPQIDVMAQWAADQGLESLSDATLSNNDRLRIFNMIDSLQTDNELNAKVFRWIAEGSPNYRFDQEEEDTSRRFLLGEDDYEIRDAVAGNIGSDFVAPDDVDEFSDWLVDNPETRELLDFVWDDASGSYQTGRDVVNTLQDLSGLWELENLVDAARAESEARGDNNGVASRFLLEFMGMGGRYSEIDFPSNFDARNIGYASRLVELWMGQDIDIQDQGALYNEWLSTIDPDSDIAQDMQTRWGQDPADYIVDPADAVGGRLDPDFVPRTDELTDAEIAYGDALGWSEAVQAELGLRAPLTAAERRQANEEDYDISLADFQYLDDTGDLDADIEDIEGIEAGGYRGRGYASGRAESAARVAEEAALIAEMEGEGPQTYLELDDEPTVDEPTVYESTEEDYKTYAEMYAGEDNWDSLSDEQKEEHIKDYNDLRSDWEISDDAWGIDSEEPFMTEGRLAQLGYLASTGQFRTEHQTELRQQYSDAVEELMMNPPTGRGYTQNPQTGEWEISDDAPVDRDILATIAGNWMSQLNAILEDQKTFAVGAVAREEIEKEQKLNDQYGDFLKSMSITGIAEGITAEVWRDLDPGVRQNLMDQAKTSQRTRSFEGISNYLGMDINVVRALDQPVVDIMISAEFERQQHEQSALRQQNQIGEGRIAFLEAMFPNRGFNLGNLETAQIGAMTAGTFQQVLNEAAGWQQQEAALKQQFEESVAQQSIDNRAMTVRENELKRREEEFDLDLAQTQAAFAQRQAEFDTRSDEFDRQLAQQQAQFNKEQAMRTRQMNIELARQGRMGEGLSVMLGDEGMVEGLTAEQFAALPPSVQQMLVQRAQRGGFGVPRGMFTAAQQRAML